MENIEGKLSGYRTANLSGRCISLKYAWILLGIKYSMKVGPPMDPCRNTGTHFYRKLKKTEIKEVERMLLWK